ncbi:hypothetical protein B9Z19DRAFT_1132800 [Tuber borchii]|uniref:Uncharacterized protein n=1 Tax=Tuber borchii TaxID=42251 RepID=A0A2T6ZGQ0_TUBBO|nr:hypothetical protein B9Z19DRAFT_1132800 [Tuber borchii]
MASGHGTHPLVPPTLTNKTKQGLIRHREVKHLQKRLDCRIPGCKSVGNGGIKRKDNLAPICGISIGFGYPANPAGATLERRYNDISRVLKLVHASSLDLAGFAMAAVAFGWCLGWAFPGSAC